VFLNIPFDEDFESLRNAIVFAVYDCGFTPRCALETVNSHESRFERITEIIRNCKLGIHDISRTELDKLNTLPRFNMPFELGLFLGASTFGTRKMRRKCALILDREPYRYQKFISDLAGQDIRAHGNSETTVISCVRDWLAGERTQVITPGGAHISERYSLFKKELPLICEKSRIGITELTYPNYAAFASAWAADNPLS